MTTRQHHHHPAERIADPSDLSELYFGCSSSSSQPTTSSQRSSSSSPRCSKCYYYYVGPVRVDRHMDKGRCLRADRDVAPGELLFVTPALAAAPVGAVRRVWLERRRQQQQQNKQQRQHPQSVAEAAERVLLEECLRRVKDDRGVRRALNALEDGRGTMKTTTPLPSMECLLGNDYGGDDDKNDDDTSESKDDDDRLLQIIRRNAFGGDFVTAEVVERRWSNVSDEEDRHFRPPRLLGHYPLAAMINHSCVPNAVRVFTVTNSEETMVAHACQRIAKDEEIVWSYIPLTQPFEIRRQRLRELGFVCHCERCEAEMVLATTAGGDGDDAASSRSSVEELEDWLASKKDDDDHRGGNRVFSNATQRYLRVSYLPLYMEHLNQNANPGNRDRYPELLKLCAQLHFSLAACHNASTEHLSILFLCYDLIGSLHTTEPTESTRRQLVFWTDQLKRAVQCRYGPLGNRLDAVRRMLQHGRTVTRNPNGMDRVEDKFI